jgi:hypothetical protein
MAQVLNGRFCSVSHRRHATVHTATAWLLAAGLCSALAGSLHAQTTSHVDDPGALLVAPESGVIYFRRSQRAAQLVADGRWAEAEALLLELTRAYPWDTGVAPQASNWGRLATALQRQDKHAEAIHAFQKVIKLQGPGLPYPGADNARYGIAASHVAAGQNEAALDVLEQMVMQDGYLRRPELLTDPNFVRLRDMPRFRALAGYQDVSGLERSDGWQRDVDHLVAELQRSMPQGTPVPNAFLRRERELRDALPALTDDEIVMRLGGLLNALDRGHTMLWLGDPDAPTTMDYLPLPVRFYVFPEGIYIVDAAPDSQDLIGSRVTYFDRTPASDALRSVAGIQSAESPMQTLWIAPHLLARPAVLAGLGIARDTRQVTLTLERNDGTTVTRTLAVSDALLLPPGVALGAPHGVEAPMFLSRHDDVHWFEPIDDRDTVYVQVNNIAPSATETMAQFGLRLRGALSEHTPSNLILDIRHNNGGNSFAYVELLRTLVAFSTIDGNEVYVLIGRDVYSAAGNLVTDLERLVRPIFVGEPTSATGNQWGDESYFVLPYSGLTGAFSGARWQLGHPWDQRRSIAPQVPVTLSAKAYFAGRDPALEAVFELIEARSRAPHHNDVDGESTVDALPST